MTLRDLIESLRLANRNVHSRFDCWQSSGSAVTTTRTQDFSTLRQEILRTARCLRNIPTDWARDRELTKEISAYRASLEQLARVLPAVQLGLQAEKGRLEAALHHLNAVNAWVDESRKNL